MPSKLQSKLQFKLQSWGARLDLLLEQILQTSINSNFNHGARALIFSSNRSFKLQFKLQSWGARLDLLLEQILLVEE